jgi:hypothetical protein
MIHNQWLRITHHDSQPLAQHSPQGVTASGSTYLTIMKYHWLSKTPHDSQYVESLIVNHCEFCCDSDCETLWAMLSQWLWITVCYIDSLIVNHCEFCWASGCEPLWDSHWISTNHHDSHPLSQHNSQWFITTGAVWYTLIVNIWFSITHHGSHLFAQNNMLSQWLWKIVSYAEPVVVNHGVFCWAIGCEPLWVILSQWLWNIVSYAEVSVCESWGSQPLAQQNSQWFTTTGSA